MEWPEELLELFDDPLLAGVRPPATRATADDRQQKKIDDIQKWIEQNGREPQRSGPLAEKLLAVSLETLKKAGLWT